MDTKSGAWTIQSDEYGRYIENFKSLQPHENYVAGAAAREFFLKSSLPKPELARVWELADITRDGKLDLTEFCIAMQLIRKRVKGATIPDRLPGALQPVRVGLETRNLVKSLDAATPAPTTSANGTLPRAANTSPLASSDSALVKNLSVQPTSNFPVSYSDGQPTSILPSATLQKGGNRESLVSKAVENVSLFDAPPDVTPSGFSVSGSQQATLASLFDSHPTFNNNTSSSFAGSSQQQQTPSSALSQLRDINLDNNNNTFPASHAPGPSHNWNRPSQPPAVPQKYFSPVSSGVSGGMPGGVLQTSTKMHSGFITYVPPPSAEWEIPQSMRLRYNQAFHEALKAASFGRASAGLHMPGNQAKGVMLKTGVEQSILAHIWNLSDLDADGQLSSEEFCVAMHLLDEAQKGHRMPDMLPPLLVPPSYRRWWQDIGSKSAAAAPAAIAFGGASAAFHHAPPTMQGGSGLPTALTGGADSGYAEGELAALGGGGKVFMHDGEEYSQAQLKTFEDKRRENFSKGQAELDRRRQHLMEMDRREKEDRERRERAAEAERQKHREEIERRQLQIEMERRMQQQYELERQQDELRKRREAALVESERQRYAELVRSRKQILDVQRQHLQDEVHAVKTKLRQHDVELEENELKNTSLMEEFERLKESVRERKGIIDGMREIRDQAVASIDQAKHDRNEWQGKLNYLRSERGALSGRKGALEHQSTVSDALRSTENTCTLRREAVDSLRDKMTLLEKSTQQKLEAVDDYNAKMRRIQAEFEELFQQNVKFCQRFDEKRAKLSKRINRGLAPNAAATQQNTAVPAALGGRSTDIARIETLALSEIKTTIPHQQPVAAAVVSKAAAAAHGRNRVPYRALYAFQARNEDEVSFQPGDMVIIDVDAGELEPGWIFGEVCVAAEPAPFGGPPVIAQKSGWLPANHVELHGDDMPVVAGHSDKFAEHGLPSTAAGESSTFHDPFAAVSFGGVHDAFGGADSNSDAFNSGGFPTTNAQHSIHANVADEAQPPSADNKNDANRSDGWAAFPTSFPPSSSTATAGNNNFTNNNDAFAPAYSSGGSRKHANNNNDNSESLPSPSGSQLTNNSSSFSAFPMPDATFAAAASSTQKINLLPPSSSSSAGRHRQPSSNNSASSTPGGSTAANVSTTTKIAMTLYPWTAKKDNHATFNKGEMVVIKKQVGGWCYGEPKQSQKPGWFPAAYVEIIKELPASGGGVEQQHDHTDAGVAAAAAQHLQLAQPPAGKKNASRSTTTNGSVGASTHASNSTSAVGELYHAEFDFHSDVSGDLAFRIGDAIRVTKREGEWWTGFVDGSKTGQTGIFPANFVTPHLPAHHHTPSPTKVGAATSGQLPQPPHSSQRHSRTSSKSAAPSPAAATVVAGKHAVGSSTNSSGNTTPTSKQPVMPFQLPSSAQDVYQALAPFKAAGPEQLTLEKGDLVSVRQKSSTGWWEGELINRGGVEVFGGALSNSPASNRAGHDGKSGWFPGE